jgi:hypothetical protein
MITYPNDVRIVVKLRNEPFNILFRLVSIYCLFLTFWQSGFSSNSEARGGPIYLKFLPNNLALISIHF